MAGPYARTLPFLAHLGLDTGADERAIRRAYARLLRQIDQEKDPEGFQALRQAYEAALVWHDRQVDGDGIDRDAATPDQDPGPEPEPEPGEAPPRQARVDPAARAHAQAQAQEVARALLQEMQARLEAGWPRDREEAAAWLQEVLGRAALVSLDARFFFEWSVAGLLAEGWQPRKEFLFGPAIDCFGWREDRGRLAAFGRAGDIVATALGELEFFDSLPLTQRRPQQELMRRLREDRRPSTRELLDHRFTLQRVAQNYPHWLHLISSSRHLEQWQACMAKVPAWRLWLAGQPKAPAAQPVGWSGERILGWIFMAFLLAGGLAKMAAVIKGPSATPVAASRGQDFGPRPFQQPDRLPEVKDAEVRRMLSAMSSSTPPRPQDGSSAATPPRFVEMPRVVYPAQARRMGLEGRVMVRLSVDTEGRPQHAAVVSSSGHAVLDEAAVKAALGARLAPDASASGRTREFRLPFDFQLSDRPPSGPAPARGYGEAVRDTVLPHIVFTQPVSGNPSAEVLLQLAADGSIQARSLSRPSGNAAWDAAVLRALDRVPRLPADADGKVPAQMYISFRPKA